MGNDEPAWFKECVNTFFVVHIPDFDSFVIWCWNNQTWVGRESCTPYPVHVLIQWELKLLPMGGPDLQSEKRSLICTWHPRLYDMLPVLHLDSFIIGCCHHILSITREVDAPHCGCMRFEYRGFTFPRKKIGIQFIGSRFSHSASNIHR